MHDENALHTADAPTAEPGFSYRHIRSRTPHVSRPVDTYQEIRTADAVECRRVDVFLDGRHLRSDSAGPLRLPLLTDHTDQTVRALTEEEFAQVWERAVAADCRWVYRIAAHGQTIYCGKRRSADSAWCTEHEEFALRMFPRLHPTT